MKERVNIEQFQRIKENKTKDPKIIENFRVTGGISLQHICKKRPQNYVAIINFSTQCKCGAKIPEIRL